MASPEKITDTKARKIDLLIQNLLKFVNTPEQTEVCMDQKTGERYIALRGQPVEEVIHLVHTIRHLEGQLQSCDTPPPAEE